MRLVASKEPPAELVVTLGIPGVYSLYVSATSRWTPGKSHYLLPEEPIRVQSFELPAGLFAHPRRPQSAACILCGCRLRPRRKTHRNALGPNTGPICLRLFPSEGGSDGLCFFADVSVHAMVPTDGFLSCRKCRTSRIESPSFILPEILEILQRPEGRPADSVVERSLDRPASLPRDEVQGATTSRAGASLPLREPPSAAMAKNSFMQESLDLVSGMVPNDELESGQTRQSTHPCIPHRPTSQSAPERQEDAPPLGSPDSGRRSHSVEPVTSTADRQSKASCSAVSEVRVDKEVLAASIGVMTSNPEAALDPSGGPCANVVSHSEADTAGSTSLVEDPSVSKGEQNQSSLPSVTTASVSPSITDTTLLENTRGQSEKTSESEAKPTGALLPCEESGDIIGDHPMGTTGKGDDREAVSDIASATEGAAAPCNAAVSSMVTQTYPRLLSKDPSDVVKDAATAAESPAMASVETPVSTGPASNNHDEGSSAPAPAGEALHKIAGVANVPSSAGVVPTSHDQRLPEPETVNPSESSQVIDNSLESARELRNGCSSGGTEGLHGERSDDPPGVRDSGEDSARVDRTARGTRDAGSCTEHSPHRAVVRGAFEPATGGSGRGSGCGTNDPVVDGATASHESSGVTQPDAPASSPFMSVIYDPSHTVGSKASLQDAMNPVTRKDSVAKAGTDVPPVVGLKGTAAPGAERRGFEKAACDSWVDSAAVSSSVFNSGPSSDYMTANDEEPRNVSCTNQPKALPTHDTHGGQTAEAIGSDIATMIDPVDGPPLSLSEVVGYTLTVSNCAGVPAAEAHVAASTSRLLVSTKLTDHTASAGSKPPCTSSDDRPRVPTAPQDGLTARARPATDNEASEPEMRESEDGSLKSAPVAASNEDVSLRDPVVMDPGMASMTSQGQAAQSASALVSSEAAPSVPETGVSSESACQSHLGEPARHTTRCATSASEAIDHTCNQSDTSGPSVQGSVPRSSRDPPVRESQSLTEAFVGRHRGNSSQVTRGYMEDASGQRMNFLPNPAVAHEKSKDLDSSTGESQWIRIGTKHGVERSSIFPSLFESDSRRPRGAFT